MAKEWSLGRSSRQGLVAALTIVLIADLAPAASDAMEITPHDDLCATLEMADPGQEIVLQPGDYRAGCVVRRGGLPGTPIVIRAADPERRPRLRWDKGFGNLLQIRAGDIVIRNLDFGPHVDADGVRIIFGNRITVEDCRFLQLNGIAVAANHSSVDELTVRRNVILDSGATGMYFGCHDGIHCSMSRLVMERNYIRGVTAPAGEVGYGLQVKLNSVGVIRDNIIVNTKGPGIMLYGSRDLAGTSVVERNFVTGSLTSSGIVIGGGPALVRNNISTANFEAGIGLEDYQQRGLLRAIIVTHNTVYRNLAAGISVPDQGLVDATFSGNAVHARAGTRALPVPRTGLRITGNTDCTWLPCFANPSTLDFSPYPGSVLVGGGAPGSGEGTPIDDFFGVRRGIVPVTGAIQKPSGPIRMRVKP